MFKSKSGSGNCEYWYFGGKEGRMKHSRYVMEQILGILLPKGSVVHHIGDSLDDSPANLVLCINDAEHKLLHLREAALKATGNPEARKCRYCKKWGVPGKGDFVRLKRNDRPTGDGIFRHKSCHTRAERIRKKKVKVLG